MGKRTRAENAAYMRERKRLKQLAREAAKEHDPAQVAHGPPPEQLQPPGIEAEVRALSKTAIRYTRAETELHIRRIEELRINGASMRSIHRMMQADGSRPEYRKITKKRVEVLWTRITEFWQESSKESAAERKEAARQRIYQMRLWALGEFDSNTKTWVRRPDQKALKGIEDLLMKLEGTAAAVEVTVEHAFTDAMKHVIVNIDPEQAAEMLQEARETRRLAELARTALPALCAASLEEDEDEGKKDDE